MLKRGRRILRIVSVALLCIMQAGVVFAAPTGKLIIFHAGSLTVPFAAMEKAFEARYPEVDVQRESGGSTRMARLISEVGKPADLMASADFQVIDHSLIPALADFNIRFATNELVLTYSEHSKFADQINQDNWFEVLGRPGVVWGHSDPNIDPGGYRSLMAIQLAEKYYRQPGLYQRLLANRPKENLRDKSVSLTSMVQNGDMDYAWAYRSIALQHHLKFVTLDEHVNLAKLAHDDFYGEVSVRVTGERPGTFIDRKGRFVAYGTTMLKDAPNREAAEAFLAYLLDPQGGQKILQQYGQPPFKPAFVPTRAMYGTLPDGIKALVEVRR
ncbi:tungstate/molybdate ABC transporter, periplasmic tungstate/molybdate-binding protein [Syntrophotalea carbinolica DSM 2380]|uniref:Tungstate/molybdate ABC transporter, periplasmic tungstate/molybdate-binding protein n=1 Tax=Syntrophotalea carbinolica (strain DSM 2380 / NBRC 103641 / GraBd1) TaxID=338963 RepID=Q3A2T3_SYNC1|nr:tungstate ABC transporter substrate-binding protein WtpA [Syntrophotalea carbinolica]ABA89324.2 tungstate/molybdate ABC transporter, periplasmic tungstate/molybdate-binding protein [Syntrophotalea carbinolica DSM 2380]